MAQKIIPLLLSYNQRNVDVRASIVAANKDQRMRNVIPQAVPNPITKELYAALYKRPGVTSTTIGSLSGVAAFYSQNQTALYEVFYNSGTTFCDVYRAGTLIGSTINANNNVINIGSTLISNKEYVVFVETFSNVEDTHCWYHPEDATVTSFTGTRSAGSPVVTGIASTTGLYSGQMITGTGFAAGTRILTVDSATQVTMNANASGNGAVTYTVEPLALVLDADYPSGVVGAPAFVDGRMCVMDGNGFLWNSDVNSVTSWKADNKIPMDTVSDTTTFGTALFTRENQIVALSSRSTEIFKNAGNPFGSPLQRVTSLPIGGSFGVQGGSTFYVIGQNASGVLGVYAWGGSLNKISTTEIDSLLSYYGADGARLGYAIVGGQEVLIFSYAGGEFVYFIATGLWAEWDLPVGLKASAYISTYDTFNKEVVFLGSTGKRYRMSLDSPVYQDESSSYSSIVQTEPHVLAGGRAFTINSIDLIADTQASGTTTLEVSYDDYGSFRTVGTFDMTAASKRIYGVGYFPNHAIFRLTNSANTAQRWQALSVDFTPAAH